MFSRMRKSMSDEAIWESAMEAATADLIDDEDEMEDQFIEDEGYSAEEDDNSDPEIEELVDAIPVDSDETSDTVSDEDIADLVEGFDFGGIDHVW
jgi:hypothetical protein